jgi:hypothetical protein
MTRTKLSPVSQRCVDCRTVTTVEEPYCGACGGRLRPHNGWKLPYDAIAAVICVSALILYWIVRD